MNSRNDMITVFVVRPDQTGQSHEFLQLRRAKSDYMGGTWQLVRGAMEADESPIAAALRELREESGLLPREFYRLGSVESFYTQIDDTLWHAIPFCAIVGRDHAVVLNDEHDDFRWIARAEMPQHAMWASERQLLADLCRDILDDGPARQYLRIDPIE